MTTGSSSMVALQAVGGNGGHAPDHSVNLTVSFAEDSEKDHPEEPSTPAEDRVEGEAEQVSWMDRRALPIQMDVGASEGFFFGQPFVRLYYILNVLFTMWIHGSFMCVSPISIIKGSRGRT